MNITKVFLGLLTALLFVTACKKEEVPAPTRLFRPVASNPLISEANFILASWTAIKGTTSYTLQVSRDTFRTIDRSIEVKDTSTYLIEGLKWDQLYQVQVRANAADSAFNSRFSNLGTIRTPKFPTILKSPTFSDVTDEAIRVSWTNGGATVTSIKVLLSPDSTLVKDVELNATDVSNQFKVISGLTSNTSYIIMLYSGSALRGYDIYTTKAPLTGTIVDLRNITDRPNVLTDTLPLISAGSTVLLKRGFTYNIAIGVPLSKAVTIQSGADLTVTVPAKLYFTSAFNFAAGSSIDYINFKEVDLVGASVTANYVFNTTASANVGTMSFENCRAEIFRGFVRFQSGTSTITNFSINNCIIDSIGGFSVLQIGSSTATTLKVENVSFKNSTIYKAELILASGTPSTSVVFDNLTINEAPAATRYLIDYTATGTVSGGITVTNCIFGTGKATSTTIRGIRASPTTSITPANNYSTSDYVAAGNLIPGLIPYPKKSTEIWENPTAGNFRIIDGAFPGRTTAGDPRWRP